MSKNTIEQRKQAIIKQWLYNKINEREIDDYFKRRNDITSVAIYGAGELGELLYDDINRHSDITVDFIIDKNLDSLYYGIENVDMINLEDARLRKAPSAIIVTPLNNREEMRALLVDMFGENVIIVFIEDLVYEVE